MEEEQVDSDVMEEEQVDSDVKELDVSRDQAQIVSMLRLTALEKIIIDKGIATQEELNVIFEELNSKFIDNLNSFVKARRESN